MRKFQASAGRWSCRRRAETPKAGSTDSIINDLLHFIIVSRSRNDNRITALIECLISYFILKFKKLVSTLKISTRRVNNAW